MAWGAVTVLLGAMAAWWVWPDDLDAQPASVEPAALAADKRTTDSRETLSRDRDDDVDWTGGLAQAASPAAVDSNPSTPNGTPLLAQVAPPDNEEPDASRVQRASAAIEAARRRFESGQILEARRELNAMLRTGLSRGDAAEVRRLLCEIADKSIFSPQRLPDDPLVEAYRVQSGDALSRIGKQFDVPHEVLLRINNMRDARRLRAGETIKVLRGPFHANIHLSEYRLDVYLQDTFVRSFPVGVGAEGATPTGKWTVKNRQPNPTYYPPPSAERKRIIPADDPGNPLGEHWIGLEGVEGDAQGRYGYGVHGTIEPDSIGKAASMGCIRMHNEDVAFVYGLLLPGKSTVTILP